MAQQWRALDALAVDWRSVPGTHPGWLTTVLSLAPDLTPSSGLCTSAVDTAHTETEGQRQTCRQTDTHTLIFKSFNLEKFEEYSLLFLLHTLSFCFYLPELPVIDSYDQYSVTAIWTHTNSIKFPFPVLIFSRLFYVPKYFSVREQVPGLFTDTKSGWSSPSYKTL